MKKCLIIALLGGSAVVCAAQTNRFPPINIYTGDPTGNVCTPPLIQQSSTTGLLYTCQGGTMKAGGSSASGTVSGQTNGKIPLATGATTIGAPSHLDDGVTTPATITSTEPLATPSLSVSGVSTSGIVSGQSATCLPKASSASALTAASSVCDNGITVTATEPIAAPSLSVPLLTVTGCTSGQVPRGDGTGLCITPSPVVAVSLTSPATAAVGTNVVTVVKLTSPAASSVSLPASSNFPGCPAASCPIYQVKDGAGNSSTYPITVSAADGKTIDGASSFIIQSNYQSITLVFNGTQWNLL